ncbi:nicotinate-nucleotide--dimethylbenzimidazole phosphoribosyltransferase [Asaia siamensis]|uniref:Nicotinate-nucleotide--dimethylbenzimidazole phosphoribosyltransferase n=1 Tax=Asaia siamensis TaxID=110479 RepID=A0ABQ1LMH3_9PROT|nr:nicotinate-nucleotide--dimethylbenzimidazole phosphoribosyltransferase [Asaia siamensis]GBR04892.1 nicotinate-nucleotide-dimethylbenzimidazole phosphoribosyltransferase [Asaia siamensis NRIC 0323]GGC25505.1 nicotinate-nucleotide--dimethylbenzimidazole phosphoribosyltransferase [Asaia siamensis]
MSPFHSLDALHAACTTLPMPDKEAVSRIRAREAVLTKPAGSLGRLEELVEWFGAWRPLQIDQVDLCIFAGNHGVLAQNVSSWPADVTAAMVANFTQQGAAINQLARVADAHLHIVPISDLTPSADFTLHPALSPEDFLAAVSAGYDAVPTRCDLLALGELGVGNTTAAAALAAALFGQNGAYWAGRGAGLDEAGLARKASAIDRALALHGRNHSPLDLARLYGGWELAALMGATLAARHRRIPVLLDGFVVTAAVAPLALLDPTGLDHTRLAHQSQEQGHRELAERLGLDPLINLQLRLGEGSGAALAIPLVRAALACHNGMARFADASIDDMNERKTTKIKTDD